MFTIRKGAGLGKAYVKISGAVPLFHKGIRNALAEAGKDVQRETRRIIRTGKRTGRVYMFRGRPHTASAVGEAPANRSGKLAKGVAFRVLSHYQMEIGDLAPYGVFLEDAMKRPHLITAINNTHQNTVNSLGEYVKVEVNK